MLPLLRTGIAYPDAVFQVGCGTLPRPTWKAISDSPPVHDKLFEAALGIQAPWSVTSVDFDDASKVLTIDVDFRPRSRFAVPGEDGQHPVHDTTIKRYRHLNFFQRECILQVRVPRAKLPAGSVRPVEPEFAGRLSGFTLLFEPLILAMAQQMTFAAVARLVGESAYRVMAVCQRYVELAVRQADLSQVTALAIDETSRARGHDYITVAADAVQRKVIFVTDGRGCVHHRASCRAPARA